MRLNKSFFYLSVMALSLIALPLVVGVTGYAADFTLPGNPIAPTACRQDAVVSTDQFTTTGIPQVRTVQPNEQVVAGAWVLADGRVPETSVSAARNCPLTAVGRAFDNYPTNVIGLRVNTSIGNAKDMDLQELDFYWDVNMNGHLDPGLDLLMQVHQESDLTARLDNENQGIVWYNGPESPLFVLGDVQPLNLGVNPVCTIAAVQQVQQTRGTNSRTLFTNATGGPVGAFLVAGPMFVTVNDPNRNVNPAAPDTVTVAITTSPGGVPTLTTVTLIETGNNTGIFVNPAAPALSVAGLLAGGTITATYIDPTNPADTSSTTATVTAIPGGATTAAITNVTTPTTTTVSTTQLTNRDGVPVTRIPVGVVVPNTIDPLEVVIPPATTNAVTTGLFVTVTDPDQNTNPALAESVVVQLTFTGGPATVPLTLTETGPNSGVFRNLAPLAVAGFVNAGGASITATYTDPSNAADVSSATSSTAGTNGVQLVAGVGSLGTQVATQATVLAIPARAIPCAVGILAVVKVGPNPKTGADFALQLQAKAADVPGAFRNSASGGAGGPSLASAISSAFAPSENPQASNILLVATGGHASSTETPVANISNGTGNVETDVTTLNFSNLKTRFRADPIKPGERDAIDIAVALCDGSAEANNQVTFLPPIAGAPPSIAGGLAALPCIASRGTDGLNTGINGATLIFSGPGAKYIRNVRLWADTVGNTYAAKGGGDGILFQPGEQIQQVTARFNPATGEAIAVFGRHQEQILSSTSGLPLIAVDPLCAGVLPGSALTANGALRCAASPTVVNPNPEILVFTSDIGQDAIGSQVDVRLGLEVGDDTAQTGRGICRTRTLPVKLAANCGSNLLTLGPETSSFEIVGPTASTPTTPPPTTTPAVKTIAQVIDANGNGIIDDAEMIAAVGYWTNGTVVPGTGGKTISDQEILKLAALWTTGGPIGTTTASSASGLSEQASVSPLTINVAGSVQVLAVKSVKAQALGNGATQFVVSGSSVAGLSVRVYDLSGTAVFAKTTSGTTLTFRGLGTDGRLLANGVYLYVVTVKGINGQSATTQVKKLVVLR